MHKSLALAFYPRVFTDKEIFVAIFGFMVSMPGSVPPLWRKGSFPIESLAMPKQGCVEG